MFRNLAFVGLCFMGITGCRETTTQTPVDLSHPVSGDMATNPNADMSMMMAMTSTTAHDIDTGNVAPDTMVKLSGMISVGNIHRHLSKTTFYCEYRTMASDPSCSSPPCGIELYERGMKLSSTSSTTDCPYADAAGSGVALGQIKNYGDVMDITGSVKAFPDQTAPMTVIAHSLTVDTVTITATKQGLPTPIDVTDTAASIFTPHTGSGWNMYEGTYVKLSPPSGKFSITMQDQFGFTVNNGALFSTSNYFGPKDGGMFPPAGATYSSISGVVQNDFGGTVDPLLPTDYAP